MNSISRRSFMMSAAAVAASVGTAGRAAANDRIGVGVIGCRNRGTTVAKHMLQAGEFDVVTMCDCDDAMLARGLLGVQKETENKPKREKDFRRLLEDRDVDAVLVATPDHWHALMTVMALDAGKHVYLEKPASHNIDDGKAMVAAQNRHPDLAVQVGTQQRSGQHFREAKDFIASGGLGKVATCRASSIGERHLVPIVPDSDPPESLDYDMWCGPAPKRPYNKELLHYNWHFLFDYGTGDMGNWGAHWLDVLRWLLGLDLPKSVSAYGGQFVVHDAKEWPDTQTVLYEYPELTIIWELRHWSRFMPGGGKGNCCEINGDKGSLTIDRGGWTFYPRDKDLEPVSHERSELDLNHVRSFADAVRGEAAPSAPIVEGHKSAVLCHLGNIAAVLNRRVEFDAKSETIVGDKKAAEMMGRRYRKPWSLREYI